MKIKNVLMCIALPVALLISAGCEDAKTDSPELTINASSEASGSDVTGTLLMVKNTSAGMVATLSGTVEGETEVLGPFSWHVSDPSLGYFTSVTGATAVFVATNYGAGGIYVDTPQGYSASMAINIGSTGTDSSE